MVDAPGTSRRRAALGAILLVLMLMPVAPSQGQLATQMLRSHEDTTWGWTLPDEPVARGTLDDDDADMAGGVLLAVPIPAPLPVKRAVEITALHVDEMGPDLIRLRLEVADIDPEALQREQTVYGITYTMRFQIGPYVHSLYGTMFTTCTNPDDATCDGLGAVGVMYQPYLYRYHIDDRNSIDLGLPPTRVLPDEEAIEVYIPRDVLRGAGDIRPAAGTTIDNVYGSSWTSNALYDRWSDYVGSLSTQDRAPLVRLTQDSYGSHVVVSTRPPTDPDIGMDPDEFGAYDQPIRPRDGRIDVPDTMPARLPLWVTNTAERKLIVVPDARISSGGEGYELRVPEGIQIPPNETRRIEILVNGTQPIDPANPLRIEFTARALGISPVGDRLPLTVRSVPQLAPDAPRLYLQATDVRTGAGAGDVRLGGSYRGMLSPLATDGDGTAKEVPLANNCLCATTSQWVAPSPLGTPALLDLARDGTLHLELDAPTAGDYRVQATAFLDDHPIGSGEAQATLAAGANSLDAPMIFSAEDPRMNAGGQISLDINAYLQTDISMGITMDQDAPRVRLQGASFIEFPLREVAPSMQTADHLVVGVGAGHDAFQYVNPGRTTGWNVTILNQGTDNDTVVVKAEADKPGWDLRIEPGKAYRIGPGESVTVGVIATAPDSAAEGDHVTVNVTADSKIAKGKGATLTVRAIVTDGIEIDNVRYAADNETASRVTTVDEANTPAPAMSLVAGVAAVLAVALRRRR